MSTAYSKLSKRAALLLPCLFSLALFSLALSQGKLQAQSRQANLEPAAEVSGGLGEPELTICSQNLQNYGLLQDMRSKSSAIDAQALKEKEASLIRRFLRARCDVIAVQELLGKNEEVATQALQQLADAIKQRTNRIFNVKTGASNDRLLRNGYLVARDRASILNTLSLAKVELPRISDRQKPRFFPRGPLEIQLSVKPTGSSTLRKTVSIINFHFKSKATSADDPTGLEWETWRMEMAEALRRLYTQRHRRAFETGETLLVLLGDRNSHFDSASARILDGGLRLKDFQVEGQCRLSKRGVPLCKPGARKTPKLFSVLTLDPEVRNQPGTFRVGRTYYWLDDILLAEPSLSFARAGEGAEADYDSGVVYAPEDASDHALVYVRLNW
jgi:endonuclease/exonuclease/phosphatase family metal-dependent hydrolase